MNNNEPIVPDGKSVPPRAPDATPKIVSTQALFEGQREICIEHEGERYVLRITRRGKLILQK
jgi:hemin uptake protein HemP